MSEMWGMVVIPRQGALGSFETNEIVADEMPFVEAIFDVGGFNQGALNNGTYTIENAAIQGDYIELEVSGGEWYLVGKSAVTNSDRHLEIYARFNDEYGTRIYLARNREGESFGYAYDDDGGDESEQDFFDIDKYKLDLEEKERKYLSIIPQVVQLTFSSILPEKPMFLSD